MRVLVLDGAERLGPPGHRSRAELANPVVPVIAVSPQTYTVTAQAGTGATFVRGTLTGQQFDAGARAVTVTMVAVP